jgi:hypothetical protein
VPGQSIEVHLNPTGFYVSKSETIVSLNVTKGKRFFLIGTRRLAGTSSRAPYRHPRAEKPAYQHAISGVYCVRIPSRPRDIDFMFSIRSQCGHGRNPRDQPGLSIPSGAVLRRSGDGGARLARRLSLPVGHVRRPSGERGAVLLPRRRGRLSVQAAFPTCSGKANGRRQPLIDSN